MDKLLAFFKALKSNWFFCKNFIIDTPIVDYEQKWFQNFSTAYDLQFKIFHQLE